MKYMQKCPRNQKENWINSNLKHQKPHNSCHIQESWHVCIIGDHFLNIFFQIIFFFVTYLFYLTTLGFLKMENKEIMTEVQSHSTPLVLHGPVVTFTQRTIQLIQDFLTITLEKHQLSWQPIYFNEFLKWELTRAFTVGRNTVRYIFIFIFLLGY